VLVVLALPPFWEFATSGLETGLTIGWIGAC
jgi:arabinofuranosyltransferase